MEQPPTQAFGLRELLATPFRHKGKIITVFLATILVAGPGSFLLTKIYRVKSRILIKGSRQPPQIGAAFTTPSNSPPHIPKDEVNTEVQIFKSPVLAEKLVQRLGHERVLEAMRGRWDWVFEQLGRPLRRLLASLGSQPTRVSLHKEAALKVRKVLKVDPVRQADVFEVSFEAPDPAFAALTLNTLVEIYLEHHLALRQAGGAKEFFSGEAERLQKQLRLAEDRLQAFKQRWGIVSIQDQKRHLLRRLTESEGALRQAQVAAVEADQRIAEIRRQLAAQSQSIPLSSVKMRNPILDNLRNQLFQLELERSQYMPESQAAIQVERKIATAHARLQAEEAKVSGALTSGVNVTYQALQKTLALERGRRKALQSRLVELEKQVATYGQSLEALDQRGQEYQELLREVNHRQEAYKLYRRKKEESRISEMLDSKKISSVIPIEAAAVPLIPVRPRKRFNMLLGAIVGLIGGLGLAYLCEYFRNSFATKEEVQQVLGRPVRASFPLANGGPGTTVKDDIQLKHLREALYRANRQQGVRSLLVTSAVTGEGKSYVATALARSLSHDGYRVLFIDAGLSCPRDQAALPPGATGAGGGSTAKVWNPGEPQPTDCPNLYALEDIEEKEAHFTHPKQVVELIGRARDTFDFVVIEGPALGPCPEGLCLASAVDGVLVVVEAERTARMVVASTVQMVEENGGHIFGIVLNKRRNVWIYDRLLAGREGESYA